MTIAEMGGFISKIAVRRSDRGGNSMNLISEVLVKLGYNDKKIKCKYDENNNIDDYGYALYQSLEYNLKYLKNDDFGFRGNLLSTMKR